MMSMKELCLRFSGIFLQNVSRSSLECGSRILTPAPVTVWSVAHRSQTPLVLRKQCRSPFIIFSTEKRSDVIKSNPGIRIPEIGRILGQMWRSLPVASKEVYSRRYQDEKEIFIAKRSAELDSLTEAQKLELAQQKEEKQNKKKTRQERKLLKSLMKPRPSDVNPYVLFFKSKSAERGETPVSVFLKRQSDIWRLMKDADRKPFVDQARANSIRYREELKRWEAKMYSQGNTHVLSPVTIRKLQKIKVPRGRKPAVGTKPKVSPSPVSPPVVKKPIPMKPKIN